MINIRQQARELAHSAQANFQGPYESGSVAWALEDVITQLVEEVAMAVIGEMEQVLNAKGKGVEVALDQIAPAARNDLRATQRETLKAMMEGDV